MHFIKVAMIFIYYTSWKKRIDVNNSVSGLTIAKNVMNMIKKESEFEILIWLSSSRREKNLSLSLLGFFEFYKDPVQDYPPIIHSQNHFWNISI